MKQILMRHLEQAAAASEIQVQAVGQESAAILFMSMLRGEGQLIALTHPQSQASDVQIDQWVNNAVTTFLRAWGVGDTEAF